MNNIKISIVSIVAAISLIWAGCATNSVNSPVVTPVVSTNSSGVLTTNLSTNIVTITTSSVNTNLIVAVESLAISTGTQVGVSAFLKNNPKDAPYVTLLSSALSLALNNGTFNATNGSAALKTTLTAALGANPPVEVLALVNDLVSLYTASEAVVVSNKLNANIFVSTGLNALASGLASAQ